MHKIEAMIFQEKNLPEAKLYSCKTSDVPKIVDHTVQSLQHVSFLDEKKLNIFSIINKRSLLVEKKKQMLKEMYEKEEQ